MAERISRWLQQIGIETKARRGWGSLVGAALLWLVVESLRHRIIGAFNKWQDNHREKAVELLRELVTWLADHPYSWLIVVVIVILVHAYRQSEQEKGVQKGPGSVEPEPLTMVDSDPRITVEFVDERADQLFKKTALNVINHGGSEALDVRIEDIPLRAQRISFPHVAGSIAGRGGKERFDPVVDRPYGALNTALLVTALKEEWNSYNDITMDDLQIPLTIRYQNFARTFKYATSCTLVFRIYEEILHHAPQNKKPVVVVRDFKHKKEPCNM